MSDLLQRVLAMPHDVTGVSRLRAELLSAYSGQPLPEPIKPDTIERRSIGWQNPGKGVQVNILLDLRAGPIVIDDWPRYCKSRVALCAHITRLRKQGYLIASPYIDGKRQYVLTSPQQ